MATASSRGGEVGLCSIGAGPVGSIMDLPPAGASRTRPGGEPVATIIPRWEWRTFGTRFGRSRRGFSRLDPDRHPGERRAVPVVAGGDNVKVRDDLLDIKVLKEVNADGLEQWTPVMKAAFPSPRPTSRGVRGAPPAGPALDREAYTWTSSSTSWPRPNGLVPDRTGPQTTRSLHDRRLHGRAVRRPAAWPRTRPSRSSPRTRPRSSRGPVDGPGRLREHQLPARPRRPRRRRAASGTR